MNKPNNNALNVAVKNQEMLDMFRATCSICQDLDLLRRLLWQSSHGAPPSDQIDVLARIFEAHTVTASVMAQHADTIREADAKWGES